MAKTRDGFYKLTASSVGSNLYVLLGGGGQKSLSDFALSSSFDNYYTKTESDNRFYGATISRTANTVLAAPNGSNGVATFRELVSADIPDLSGKYLPLSGGIMNKDAYISWNASDYGDSVSDWNTVTGHGLRIISSTAQNTNAPKTYSTALHVKGSYGFLLASEGGALANSFFIRNINNSIWNTLLHSNNSLVSGGGSTWGSSITVNIGGNSKTLTIPSKPTDITGNAGTSTRLVVNDVRDTDHLPSSDTYPDKTVTAWFNMTGTPTSVWYSGLTVKGWTDAYQSWLLASGSTTSLNGNLYYRNGINDTWQSWKAIAFTSDIPTKVSLLTNDSGFLTSLPSHTHSYLPLTGGTISNTSYGPLTIERKDSTNMAAIKFKNSSGDLGSIGMNTVDGSLLIYNAGISAYRTILDSGNYTSWVNTTNFPGLNKTGTVTQVKIGSTAYNPSSGIVSLPAYPTSLPANGGNADTVDNLHASDFAKIGTYNNLTHAGNEFTFASSAFSGEMWINYRTASGSTDGNITKYNFGNGKGSSLAYISANYFSGTAAAANSVAWGNITGKPSSFTPSTHTHPYIPINAYNFTSGCLVKLSVASASNSMISVHITGNAYSTSNQVKVINSIVEFYNYTNSNDILSYNATHFGYNFGDIKIFNYDNKVCLWFKQDHNYMSFSVFANYTNSSSAENVVSSISNSAMPTSGVTRSKTITPKTVAYSSDLTWSNISGKPTITDTKNTAGSTNTSSAIYLIGATTQAANPQTYSHDTVYIGTDGCLYSNKTKVSVEGHTHSYLPLSGGTVTGTITFSNGSPGIIVNRSSGVPYIRFGSGSTIYGEYGVNASGNAVFWPAVSTASGYGTWCTLIHSGNIGSYRGYIGTTAVQASSAALSLTGIGSITPAAHNTYSLGASGTRWNYVYANYMYASTAFYQSSDKKLKDNIQILSKDLLDKVYNVKEVSFNWKDSGKQAFGYIAQDYEQISDVFVGKDENGTLSLDYTEVLVAQIAALKLKIVNLEERLQILERS